MLTARCESPDDVPASATPDGLKSFARALGSARSLAFSPDGNLLAVCGGSFANDPLVVDGTSRNGVRATTLGRLKVWDIKNGTLIHDLFAFGYASAVTFSPDGSVLACAGSWIGDGASETGVLLWNPQTGEKLDTITNSDNLGTWSVAYSPDGQQMAIGSLNQDRDQQFPVATVSLTNVATGKTQWRQQVVYTYSSGRIAFAPDGNSIVVLSGREKSSIKLLDVATGITRQEIRSTVNKPMQEIWSDFAIAPQGGKLLISGTADGIFGFVEVWEFDAPQSKGSVSPTTGSTASPAGN